MDPTPTATPDAEVVICKVNDATILRSDFVPVFNSYYENFSMYYGIDFTNEENLKWLQNDVFQMLLEMEVCDQKAKELGFQLTDAEMQVHIDSVQAEYDALIAYYVAQAAAEGAADAEKRGMELMNEVIVASGYDPDTFYETFMEDAEYYARLERLERLEENVRAQVVYTSEQAQQDFAADLEYYHTRYEENPNLFSNDYSAYEKGSGPLPLYTPEGYRRVKHILVEEETLAQELLQRIRAGEDFDVLMAEYGTDSGMKNEPAMSAGYLMNENTNFVPEFLAAAGALENVGDITEPVKSMHGYHIIRLESILISADAVYEEVAESYMASKSEEARQAYYNEQVGIWVEEADVVSYIGRIRDVGKVS
ncbi:peptidylprolyl isomerase [Christensenellaceae bacterium OttesenSCG-928-L17]|nr:peptidylprolyl isomerase [Christensenellaceae bacterium OttesenSCG-928-L17]